jgi:hypothetical protein
MLASLSRLREGESRRISSFDTTGGNRDCWTIRGGETRELARITGPGCIRHIWITVSAEDEWYLRKTLLRAYWDGESTPSIESPLGDFFGVGHGVVSSFSCAVLNMSANQGETKHAAMNCYFPMPFSEGARIEVVNESDKPIGAFYFYVDYDLLPAAPEEHGRFHAKWRRENPTDGWVPVRPQEQPDRGKVGRVPNLTDRENYLFVEAKGRGHFVGVNLSVHNLCGGWWGEGDDMFMIDGEKWPPDLHGTGSEDYFGHAWGMQPHNAYMYNGVSYHRPGTVFMYNERITVYRFHINEPVIFQKSLRASIEHGHANSHSNDYSSVAYWYQTEPHHEFCEMLPVEARLPRPDFILGHAEPPGPARVRGAVRDRMARQKGRRSK